MVDVPAIDDTGESLGRKRSLGSGRRRPSRRDIELTWGLRKKSDGIGWKESSKDRCG
jgi:hypothetical protein